MKLFRVLVYLFANLAFVLACSNIAYCEQNRTLTTECKLTGFIDFSKKKLWFGSDEGDKILLCLSGSSLSLDDALDAESSSVWPFNVQGSKWLLIVPKGKPIISDGIDIKNFDKTKKLFDSKGLITIYSPVYRVTTNGHFSGPYILKNGIRVIEAKPGMIEK